MGQEKPDKNADILTVNIAVLPSLSDTVSLSSSPIYSGSIVWVINFMLAIIIHEEYISSASKNEYFFDNHRIFADWSDWNIKTMQ